MKKIIVLLVIGLVIALAGTYFYFAGKEYSIRLSESQIQSKLEKKMPLSKSVFLIIKVTLDNPRVKLENGSSRINAGMDVLLNITVQKQSLPLGGSIDISGGIKYNPETAQFFLTDPIIENLKIQGLPEKHSNKANKALSKVLAEFYKKNPIYTLKAKDAKKAAAKLLLKNVIVDGKELVVTLGI